MKRKMFHAAVAGLALVLGVGVSGFASPQSAEKLAVDALVCFDRMEYEKGLKLAGKALEKGPDSSRYPRLLLKQRSNEIEVLDFSTKLRLRQAAVLWKLGRAEEAWLSVKKVLDNHPENCEAGILATYFSYLEKRFQEAFNFAQKTGKVIKRVFRSDHKAKRNWTVDSIYAAMEIPPSSRKPIEIYPNNTGLGFYIQAIILQRQGRNKEAEAYFWKAMAWSYDAASCALAVGLGRLDSGDWRGARTAVQDALDEGGSRDDLYLLAAAADLIGGDSLASEEALKKSVELRLFEPLRLKALAAACAARDDGPQAARLWN